MSTDTGRETLLVQDAAGQMYWTDLPADCRCWTAARYYATETLYRVQNRWVIVLQPWECLSEDGKVATGKLASDIQALQWILDHGRAVPPELAELAERFRLPRPKSVQCRTSARRRKRRHRLARRSATCSKPGSGNDSVGVLSK
jgi:hypothetical protein